MKLCYLLLISMLLQQNLQAESEVYPSKEHFLTRVAGPCQIIRQIRVPGVLPATRQHPCPSMTVRDSLTFLILSDTSDTTTIIACFSYAVIEMYNQVHTIGMSFTLNGTLQQIGLIEPVDRYGRTCATPSFIRQFMGKNVTQWQKKEGFDGVSGATHSAREIEAVLCNAVHVYHHLVQPRLQE